MLKRTSLISLLLMISIIISSCFTDGKNRECQVISEDTPWYECTKISLGTEYDDFVFNDNQAEADLIGMIDDIYVCFVYGQYGGQDSGEKSLFDICYYDGSGNLIDTFDLQDILSKQFPVDEYIWPTQFLTDGSLFIEDDCVHFRVADLSLGRQTTYSIDPENDSISECYHVDAPRGWDWNDVNYCLKTDGYTIYIGNDTAQALIPAQILTVTPDGESLLLNCGDVGLVRVPQFFDTPLPLGGGIYLLKECNTNILYRFDSINQTVTQTEDEYGEIDSLLTPENTEFVTDEGDLIFLDDYEITKVDPEEMSSSCLFDVNNLDINKEDYNFCTVLSISEDSIKLKRNRSYMVYVYDLTRADVNPHAGKKILTTDGISLLVYDAAYKFNNEDGEYFISFVPNKYVYDSDLDLLSDDYRSLSISAKSSFEDQLRVDLVSGDCPDIVFCGATYPELLNSEYMTDLAPYLNSSGIREHLASNALSEDGLYIMPLTYSVAGLGVNSDRYEHNSRSITLDEYKTLTNEYFDGISVAGYTQMDFLLNEVAYNYDLFLKDGRPDFDCDEFRALAEFTKDSIMDSEKDSLSGYITSATDFKIWLNNMQSSSIPFSAADMVSFPVFDQRGLGIRITEGVSVPVSCACPEGAWRFIMTMIDPDVGIEAYSRDLVSYGDIGSYAIPINLEVMDYIGAREMELHNRMVDEYSTYGFSGLKPATWDDFLRFKEMVTSADHIITSDSSVDLILYEEMQAYFNGDKDLETTIELINNRIDLVFDERGT